MHIAQAAASSEAKRKQGDSEHSESLADEPVTEADALDLQELFKKAITSSAV